MRQNDKGSRKEAILGRELTETELATICGGATERPGSQTSENSQSQYLGELTPTGVVGLLGGVIDFAGLGLSTSSTNPNSAVPQISNGLPGLLSVISGGSL